MINSISNTTQIYTTSKVTKTTAISAYSEVSSAKPLSRMDQMQEKYKDVYSPMPSNFSKEQEKDIENKIYEKYPELYEKYNLIIDASMIPQNQAKTIYLEDKQEKQNMMKSLNISEDDMLKITNYKSELSQSQPNNIFAKNGEVSNSKELANFFNAAVYEELENGKDLKTAYDSASLTTSNYMDTSGQFKQAFNTFNDFRNRDKVTFSNEKPTYDTIDYDLTIDLRDYGIEHYSKFELSSNENNMISMLEGQLKVLDFIHDNPDVVEKEFDHINHKMGATVESIFNSASTLYEPTKLALDVFNKYKIFDSIDIKA